MKIRLVQYVALIASVIVTGLARAQTGPWTDALTTKVRAAASMVPGAPPRALHVLRVGFFADPAQSNLLDGGSKEQFHVTYPVFQIRFEDGWIVVDAPVDTETAGHPSIAGAITIPTDRYEQFQRALVGARSIVITHEHGDHAAGIIRNPALEVIAPKTLLTRVQVQTMIEHPDKYLPRFDASKSDRYCVFDYDLLYPLAPGVVLIKAPGHTPGSQIVYVRLASGKEILLIGDITWVMAGIEQRRLKPEATSKELELVEDRAAIQRQIEWLRNNMAKMSLVCSHDNDSISALIRKGILEEGLDLRVP